MERPMEGPMAAVPIATLTTTPPSVPGGKFREADSEKPIQRRAPGPHGLGPEWGLFCWPLHAGPASGTGRPTPLTGAR